MHPNRKESATSNHFVLRKMGYCQGDDTLQTFKCFLAFRLLLVIAKEKTPMRVDRSPVANIGKLAKKCCKTLIALTAISIFLNGCIPIPVPTEAAYYHRGGISSPIRPGEVVAILAPPRAMPEDEALDPVASSQSHSYDVREAEQCLRDAIHDTHPGLRIIGSDELRQSDFSDQFVEAWNKGQGYLQSLMADPTMTERLKSMGVRLLLLLDGHTHENEGNCEVRGGSSTLGFLLSCSSERTSALTVSAFEPGREGTAGEVHVHATGMRRGIAILPGPGVLLFPMTESRVCNDLHATVSKFLQDELAVEVQLAPTAPQVPINAGTETTIVLSVADERAEKVLGHEGPARSGSKIITPQSLDAILLESLQKGFSALGFHVLIATEIPRKHPEISITLQNLEYWVAYYVFVDATAKAAVSYQGEPIFEQTYKISNRFGKSSEAGAVWIEEKINASLSDLIAQIVRDPDLRKAVQSSTHSQS